MIKLIIVFFSFFALFLAVTQRALAIENPLVTPNNKVGVHILFPSELEEAAVLINSSGGEWGYVTIPIQAGDRDLEKWQKFMDDAKKHKVIPLVRLATEGDYFNTKVWRKPTFDDIIDFANFLNSLSWPTKNRYIIVFNEVNRSDEWGGNLNPAEYAEILSYANYSFKFRNPDFFIIMSGLDNASVTVDGQAMEKLLYMQEMHRAIPDIFTKIDGLGSHAYPNPAFAQPPTQQHQLSIASFRYETALIRQLATVDLPIFITETGWSNERVADNTIAQYYTHAFTQVWNDEKVVAVTPFLLRASHGPFTAFSLFKIDGSKTEAYNAIVNLPKIKGEPILAEAVVLGTKKSEPKTIKTKNFSSASLQPIPEIAVPNSIKIWVKWLLKM